MNVRAKARSVLAQLRAVPYGRLRRNLVYRLTSPRLQLVSAILVMVGGAAIVSTWCLGMTVMFGGLLWAGDAIFRDPAKTPRGQLKVIETTHQEVIARAQMEP